MNLLLIGNPNVGKSVLFSRLTGIKVITSNYPGTTVTFTKGKIKLGENTSEVIDVPGIYTLEPLSKAEEVATEMLKDGDIVINVVDATNLERNLFLTLQLLEKYTPTIVALNLWDDAKHKGIQIDIQKLENLLGVPVVPTVALTGQGIKDLVDRITEAKKIESPSKSRDELWAEVGRITREVQSVTHRHHTFLEHLGDASIKPFPGILIAFFILFAAFWVIRLVGEGMIGYIFEPFFNSLWNTLMMQLSGILGSGGFLHDVLVGKLINGSIDFNQSFGILTTGLFISIGVVLPYVIAFYAVLSFIEDIGYLPRLAVMLDTIMHKMGIHGYAIIPMLLGLGCNVPGIMATRILESKRERFIVSTIISIAIPCASLQAMIIGLVGRHGLQYVALIYGTLFVVWLVLGLLLNRIVKGFTPELIIEIPPYRLPPLRSLGSKLWLRIRLYFKEAIPIVMLGIVVITILYALNIFDYIAELTAPVVNGLFGLPQGAAAAITIGFLRKDMAVGMLGALNLSAHQLVIGCVILAMFFPCIATFTVLGKELGFKKLLASTGIMLASSLLVGTLLNIILN